MSTQAKNEAMKDLEAISLYSRWIGTSQVRIRVNKIDGNNERIIVDLFELSPENVSVDHDVLNDLAKEAAMNQGFGPGFLVLRDYLTERKCKRLDWSFTVTNIRTKTYVF